jgi:hypothetical protein
MNGFAFTTTLIEELGFVFAHYISHRTKNIELRVPFGYAQDRLRGE